LTGVTSTLPGLPRFKVGEFGVGVLRTPQKDTLGAQEESRQGGREKRVWEMKSSKKQAGLKAAWAAHISSALSLHIVRQQGAGAPSTLPMATIGKRGLSAENGTGGDVHQTEPSSSAGHLKGRGGDSGRELRYYTQHGAQHGIPPAGHPASRKTAYTPSLITTLKCP
jgi:hypothetical protein